jgi:RNase P/RNase MRP subunit POP5
VGKKAVHEALKSLGSVAKAKGHIKVFKEAERSNYGCFRNVRGSNRNLMIAFD